MKKSECEVAIRHLCGEWAKLRGIPISSESQPSFSDFLAWLRDRYPAYLKFRTAASVEFDVEVWFDEELKQTSRR